VGKGPRGAGEPKWNRGNRKRSQEVYRKKVFSLFKRKGQKAKIRKNTLGNKQTKGKKTNNCHDHLFNAKCTKSPFLFSGAKKVRLENLK
jgi:hypothetical protein